VKYRVLGDIAFEAGRNAIGLPIHATAVKGDLVALNLKDAAALLARGDVIVAEHHDDVVTVTPSTWPALPPHDEG